jgi:hypothetical protein
MAIDLSKYTYELKTMPWNTWQEAFLPVQNEINVHAKYGGRFFVHEGEEWQHVVGHFAQQIWTMVEEEDGTLVLRNGVYVKNRRGYFLCERMHNPREFFRVPVPAGEEV